jgi:hypothetical protein
MTLQDFAQITLSENWSKSDNSYKKPHHKFNNSLTLLLLEEIETGTRMGINEKITTKPYPFVRKV